MPRLILLAFYNGIETQLMNFFNECFDAMVLPMPSARRAWAKKEKNSLLLFHYNLICTK